MDRSRSALCGDWRDWLSRQDTGVFADRSHRCIDRGFFASSSSARSSAEFRPDCRPRNYFQHQIPRDGRQPAVCRTASEPADRVHGVAVFSDRPGNGIFHSSQRATFAGLLSRVGSRRDGVCGDRGSLALRTRHVPADVRRIRHFRRSICRCVAAVYARAWPTKRWTPFGRAGRDALRRHCRLVDGNPSPPVRKSDGPVCDAVSAAK